MDEIIFPDTPYRERPLNRELLTLTRDFLREHPERHAQDLWMSDWVAPAMRAPELDAAGLVAAVTAPDNTCGTAGCFAGWASLFAGYRQSPHMETIVIDSETGDEWTMRVAAYRALGLTLHQAEALFHPANTIEDIIEGVDRILANENDPLVDIFARAEDRDAEALRAGRL
jgi:hypothetical protein